MVSSTIHIIHQTEHLATDCPTFRSRYSKYPHVAALGSLPAETYAHEAGCASLKDAVNFIGLLSTIRHHLYTSEDTQQYYVSIAREFHSKLLESNRGGDHEPSLDDFRNFIVDHWPTFRSIHEIRDRVVWGRVSKLADSANEVGILSSLIWAAEAANSGQYSDLPLPLYNLILTVVILHEISHSFTRYLFDNTITPEGVGSSTEGGYGELGDSGWLLEDLLMQGRVNASWDHEMKVGQMLRIKRVILEKDNSSHIISVDTAKNFLESLNYSRLTLPWAPPHSHLTLTWATPWPESLDTDFRARVTETTFVPKKDIGPVIGLGFCSYLGSDRWETP